MRPSRLLALAGMAAGIAALVLPSLANDTGLVASLTGTPVPSIWASLTSSVQWWLVGAALTGVGSVLWTGRTRPAMVGVVVVALGAGYLVWQGRGDAVAAAHRLAGDLEAAAESGLIAASPGAAPGLGFAASLSGFGLAVLAAVWGLAVPCPASAVKSAATVEADTEEAWRPNPGVRYLDLVIEDEDPSPGE